MTVTCSKAILLLMEDSAFARTIAQSLEDEGYAVHQIASGQGAIDLINEKTFDVVVASSHTSDDVTGMDVLVHHELISPGHGRILLIDFISPKVDYLVSFIGALCVPTETPPDKLLIWIKTVAGRTSVPG